MSDYDFDVLVIGAGSGGVRFARMSAGKGAKVAVIEARYLGGTCVNVGCVPKKLFVYASHVAEELEDGAGFGWSNSGKLSFDWSTLVKNKDREIKRLNGIYERLLLDSGVTIFSGTARFENSHQVEINGQSVSADRIVIATGSWPYVPDFPGNDLAITSNELFYLDSLPETAVVLGGGYIAVEMAGILNGLGLDTTLIYRGEHFLRGFDGEIRTFVADQMRLKGVNLVFGDNISALRKSDQGDGLTIELLSGKSVAAGLVLAATGRKPLTDGLKLENTAVKLNDKGEILVDSNFQTDDPAIFALGDVTGGPQLTPVALAEGMHLAHMLFGEAPSKPVDYTNIPTAVFCQPNIATVGLTEEEAIDAGIDLSVYVSQFKPMKHTMSGREERSLMKLLVDRDTDRVIGAHMVGPEAGEIIQGIAVAIKAGASKQDFDRTIGIHPTAAEEFVTMRQPR